MTFQFLSSPLHFRGLNLKVEPFGLFVYETRSTNGIVCLFKKAYDSIWCYVQNSITRAIREPNKNVCLKKKFRIDFYVKNNRLITEYVPCQGARDVANVCWTIRETFGGTKHDNARRPIIVSSSAFRPARVHHGLLIAAIIISDGIDHFRAKPQKHRSTADSHCHDHSSLN